MIQTEEYMSSPVITCSPDTTVTQLTELMDKHNIGSIIVTQEDEKVAGIVTERDIVRKVLAHHKHPDEVKTEEIMTKSVHTLGKHASLLEVASSMKEFTMRRIVVVEDDKPVGIITARDVIGLLI